MCLLFVLFMGIGLPDTIYNAFSSTQREQLEQRLTLPTGSTASPHASIRGLDVSRASLCAPLWEMREKNLSNCLIDYFFMNSKLFFPHLHRKKKQKN